MIDAANILVDLHYEDSNIGTLSSKQRPVATSGATAYASPKERKFEPNPELKIECKPKPTPNPRRQPTSAHAPQRNKKSQCQWERRQGRDKKREGTVGREFSTEENNAILECYKEYHKQVKGKNDMSVAVLQQIFKKRSGAADLIRTGASLNSQVRRRADLRTMREQLRREVKAI